MELKSRKAASGEITEQRRLDFIALVINYN